MSGAEVAYRADSDQDGASIINPSNNVMLKITPRQGELPEVYAVDQDGITEEMLAELIGSTVPVAEVKYISDEPLWAEVLAEHIPRSLQQKESVNGGMSGWQKYVESHPRPQLAKEDQRKRGETRDGTGIVFFVLRKSGTLVKPVPEV